MPSYTRHGIPITQERLREEAMRGINENDSTKTRNPVQTKRIWEEDD